MLKEESCTLGFESSTTRAQAQAHVCDACLSAPSTVFCRADSAYLCAACDAKIHSANSLARCHHRVLVVPIPGSLYGPQATDPRAVIGLGVESKGRFLSEGTIDDDEEDETASWFLFNGEGGVDEYLDLVEYNSCQDTQYSDDQKNTNDTYNNHSIQGQQQSYTVNRKSYGGGDADSVVPVTTKHHQKFQLGMEYDTSSASYGYPAASLSQSISMSSLDIGIVPDSTITEVSHSRTPKGTIDLFSSPLVQVPTQLTPMDREARVLRYREKKKTRKFEKTIRYASRKAYAETRPRIKGRFAKRTSADTEVDQMFSTTLMTEGGYCIVPSFSI